VTHHGRQLLITLAMTCVVVFIYTIFAFKFFQDFYKDGETERFVVQRCVLDQRDG
jgi:undecaprenyl pyrophosphate phosphatase UppP